MQFELRFVCMLLTTMQRYYPSFRNLKYRGKKKLRHKKHWDIHKYQIIMLYT